MNPQPDSTPAPGAFATTRWTLVIRSRGETPEARAALSDLCTAYYPPVEAFLARESGTAEKARELAQEFFARLLAGSGIGGADARKGRFRSYLLGAVKHFLHAERVRQRAAKRGGGQEPVSLDAPAPGSHETAVEDTAPPIADLSATPPDLAFDRHWAHQLLARALDRLAREMTDEGKARQFETLRTCLLGASAPPPQAELAAALGLSETAVKVAIHRLRARFRETVRAEIGETLSDPDPGRIDEEMRHLVQALGG